MEITIKIRHLKEGIPATVALDDIAETLQNDARFIDRLLVVKNKKFLVLSGTVCTFEITVED